MNYLVTLLESQLLSGIASLITISTFFASCIYYLLTIRQPIFSGFNLSAFFNFSRPTLPYASWLFYIFLLVVFVVQSIFISAFLALPFDLRTLETRIILLCLFSAPASLGFLFSILTASLNHFGIIDDGDFEKLDDKTLVIYSIGLIATFSLFIAIFILDR